ncbi:MAG: hypothetical protein K6E86_10485 [Bacteroidales bacterium]|nr:hypothetical protein [Bacteroidales bacterium]
MHQKVKNLLIWCHYCCKIGSNDWGRWICRGNEIKDDAVGSEINDDAVENEINVSNVPSPFVTPSDRVAGAMGQRWVSKASA